MKHQYLVYRQEKFTPDCFTLIKAETDDSIKTERELLDAIRFGIQEWVKTTDAGRKAYGYAGEDMNIGDISGHEDEIVQHAKGVKSLSFESLDAAQDWVYDTSLCGYIEQ